MSFQNASLDFLPTVKYQITDINFWTFEIIAPQPSSLTLQYYYLVIRIASTKNIGLKFSEKSPDKSPAIHNSGLLINVGMLKDSSIGTKTQISKRSSNPI